MQQTGDNGRINTAGESSDNLAFSYRFANNRDSVRRQKLASFIGGAFEPVGKTRIERRGAAQRVENSAAVAETGESYIIDVQHWRHYFLIVGLVVTIIGLILFLRKKPAPAA